MTVIIMMKSIKVNFLSMNESNNYFNLSGDSIGKAVNWLSGPMTHSGKTFQVTWM